MILLIIFLIPFLAPCPLPQPSVTVKTIGSLQSVRERALLSSVENDLRAMEAIRRSA